MSNRMNTLASQVSGSSKSPDDIVICCAIRTPLTRAKKGPLANATLEDLLVPLFKETIKRTKLDPQLLGDITIGNCLAPGSAQLSVRIASQLAGFPDTVPCYSINRLCSSGLQAVATVAGAIATGTIEVGLAGGVESMSMFNMQELFKPENLSESIFENEAARNVMIPMGMTSENVAEKFKVSRETQDKFAVESHAKAARAQETGLYDSEIVPITVKDPKTGKDILVSKDDGIRKGTTLQSLSALGPAFKPGGSTTAGNASQTTDGAAVVLVAKRSFAVKYNLPILARMVSFAVVGCPPEIMGIGPAIAIPKALSNVGLTVNEIDIFEVNEAFASQATYCAEKLKIPKEKLNPKGGAIALGHPLGCSGARMIATLLPELKRTGKKRGVVSMCVGGGMGAAGIFERE